MDEENAINPLEYQVPQEDKLVQHDHTKSQENKHEPSLLGGCNEQVNFLNIMKLFVYFLIRCVLLNRLLGRYPLIKKKRYVVRKRPHIMKYIHND